MSYQLIRSSAHATGLPDKSVHCGIWSPPYFGLRAYDGAQDIEWPTMRYAPMPGLPELTIQGCDPDCQHEWSEYKAPAKRGSDGVTNSTLGGGKATQMIQRRTVTSGYCIHCGGWRGGLGSEPTPEEFIGHLILVLREQWRVLRDDGVCFVNLGDSFSGSNKGVMADGSIVGGAKQRTNKGTMIGNIQKNIVNGIRPKNMFMIPHRFALAAQADGWIVRSDMPWLKRNCLPESCTDRPNKATEYIFMLVKSERYFFDMEAVKQPVAEASVGRAKRRENLIERTGKPVLNGKQVDNGIDNNHGYAGLASGRGGNGDIENGRNFRNSDFFFRTWQGLITNDDGDPLALVVNPKGYSGAHFATFPMDLPLSLIKAGSSAYGVCSHCGAPWRRLVSKDNPDHTGSTNTLYPEGSTGNRMSLLRQAARERGEEYVSRSITVGWEPTCACDLYCTFAPDDFEIINTPTGEAEEDDPSIEVGRAGMSRPRGDDEGIRPITRYEQRQYAKQMRMSPHKDKMASEAGSAFEHYIRTDRSGARPVPDDLLHQWIERGWLDVVVAPERHPYDVIPATILDLFNGSGTTGRAALQLGRSYIGVDVSAEYLEELAPERLGNVQMEMQLI